jgi:hypothetical protein
MDAANTKREDQMLTHWFRVGVKNLLHYFLAVGLFTAIPSLAFATDFDNESP